MSVIRVHIYGTRRRHRMRRRRRGEFRTRSRRADLHSETGAEIDSGTEIDADTEIDGHANADSGSRRARFAGGAGFSVVHRLHRECRWADRGFGRAGW